MTDRERGRAPEGDAPLLRAKDYEPRVCQRCGNPLPSVRGGRKYCIDCQEIRRLEAEHRRSEKKRGIEYEAAPPRRVEKKRKDRGGMTISEVVREAARLGMSYGEYVAKYEPRKEVKKDGNKKG